MRRLAFLTLCSLVAAACSGGSAPSRDQALVIREGWDQSHGSFIEGSITFLTLADGRGDLVLRRRLVTPNRPEVVGRVRLPAGTYELRLWQRPCSATCSRNGGALLAPTAFCVAPVRVEAGRTNVLTISASTQGCSVETGAAGG